MSRILFLDIDGVLNSYAYDRKRDEGKSSAEIASEIQNHPELDIDPDAVRHLNAILAATGAKVVISSQRRTKTPIQWLKEMLVRRGFVGEIVGTTPWDGDETRSRMRGQEIQQYLYFLTSPDTAIAILDDADDMAHLGHRLIQTDSRYGLGPEHIARCIQILSVPLGDDGDVDLRREHAVADRRKTEDIRMRLIHATALIGAERVLGAHHWRQSAAAFFDANKHILSPAGDPAMSATDWQQYLKGRNDERLAVVRLVERLSREAQALGDVLERPSQVLEIVAKTVRACIEDMGFCRCCGQPENGNPCPHVGACGGGCYDVHRVGDDA